MNPPYHFDWIEFRGCDAEDFFNRVSTINLKTLGLGRGSRGLFLSATGKIEAYFWLWRLQDENGSFLAAEVPHTPKGEWKKHFLECIERFHFGEDLGVQSEKPSAPRQFMKHQGQSFSAVLEGGAWITHHGAVEFGCDMAVGPASAFLGDLEESRVSAALPGVDHEIILGANPLDIALWDAVAPNKGCYPGQEVIERTRAKGEPARKLCLLEGVGPPPSHSSADTFSSIALETKTQAKGWRALAVVSKRDAEIGRILSFGTSQAEIKLIQNPPREKS